MEFAGQTSAVPPAMFDTHDGKVAMALDGVEIDATKTTPWERRFNPYDFNGGCVLTAHILAGAGGGAF
jgi:hypothetical protein